MCEVVERWNHYARIRQDLFDVIDIVAVKPGHGLIGVQVTTTEHLSERRDKIEKSDKAQTWIKSGLPLILHGWAKRGPRGKRKVWTLQEESL